jgi:hypothetical protein
MHTHQLLGKMIVERSVEPMIAVRAITSKYRMTNTPVPSSPSLYVRGVTQPLHAAIAGGSGGAGGREGGFLALLCSDSRAQVLANVVEAVAGKYSELVLELFANVKRLGQTLKKLQKGTAAVGDGGMGDEEKIFLQVCGLAHVPLPSFAQMLFLPLPLPLPCYLLSHAPLPLRPSLLLRRYTSTSRP